MKRIDLESHFYTQDILDTLAARDTPPCYNAEKKLLTYVEDAAIPLGALHAGLMDMAERRIELMDRNGIDVAVFSISPGVEHLPTGLSLRAARRVNDTLAGAVRAHPGRLLGSAILPVGDPAAACSELERCVKELGFVAWHVHSNFGEHSPDEARYLPIFKKAEELGVYVYLHPCSPVDVRFRDYGFMFCGAALGFTLDTMVTVTRMILSGLLDQCPGLKLILGHLGEALPFLLERMDNRFALIPDARHRNRRPFSRYFTDGVIFVTTSGNMSKQAFTCTKEVLGIDRILFASDYPYEAMDDMVSFVNGLPLSTSEREALYGGNAVKLMGGAS